MFLRFISDCCQKLQTDLRPIAVNLVSISVDMRPIAVSVAASVCLENFTWFRSLILETDRDPSEIGRKIGLKPQETLKTFTGIGLIGPGLGRSDLRPVAEHGLATRDLGTILGSDLI